MIIEKIKNYFKKETVTKQVTMSEIDSIFCQGNFDTFSREQSRQILDKMNGYQYIAADLVAKTIASQKLRLYSRKASLQSKFHKGKEELIRKNIEVKDYRKDYLMGEHASSHNNLMHKSLNAEEGIVQILDHPSLDLIRDINPHSNQWEFLYLLTMAVQYFGNSFWEKIRNTDGTIAQLWYAPPQHMKIVQGKTIENFIDHYKFGESFGTPIIIQPENMLDFKMPGIGCSQVYGTSKIEVIWKYIGLLDSSLAFSKAIMDNTGRPDILLIAEDAKDNIDALTRLENRWNDRNYGVKNAGKMSTVPGKIKVEILPRTEFDFDNDTALIRAIASGFGVPSYKLLPSSGALVADDSASERDFLKTTIDSYLTLIEDILNENLLTEWGVEGDLFFAFDPVIREDEELKLKKQVAKTDSGHWTLNEVRQQDGLEPFEGGDDGRYKGKSILSMDTSSQPSTEPTSDEDKAMKEDIEFTVKRILDANEPKKELEPVKMPDINININNIDEQETEDEDLKEDLSEENIIE